MAVPRRDDSAPLARRKGTLLAVRAAEAGDLAALAVTSVGEPRIDRLEVDLATWRRPRGWIGHPGIRGLTSCSVEPRRGGARLALAFAEPVDPGRAIAAALRALRPSPTGDTGRLTFAAGLPAAASPLAASVADVLPDEPPAGVAGHLRRADTVVCGDGGPGIQGASAVIVREGRWTVDGTDHEVVVDPLVHRPIGRRSDAASTIADARVEGDALAIEGDGISLRIKGDLREGDVDALTAIRGLRVRGGLPHRWGAQLAACGVVVDGAGFPAAGEHLAWLTRSVDASRHALRAHSPAAALDAWPTVSAVLVTHRPDFIEHAVRQLAGLDYPRLQLVIGRHGDAFDPAALAPLAGRDLAVVEIDRSRTLGEALALACARADGTLLAKLDDDDWYGREHVWDLVLARMASGAQLVGKALDWIHAQGSTVFRPAYPAERYATFVAGGTLLISRADLGACGGWRPVPRSVDRGLIDRVRLDGGLVYRTHGLGYVYVRHGDGHTATVDDAHFLTKAAATWPGLVRDAALGTDA